MSQDCARIKIPRQLEIEETYKLSDFPYILTCCCHVILKRNYTNIYRYAQHIHVQASFPVGKKKKLEFSRKSRKYCNVRGGGGEKRRERIY